MNLTFMNLSLFLRLTILFSFNISVWQIVSHVRYMLFCCLELFLTRFTDILVIKLPYLANILVSSGCLIKHHKPGGLNNRNLPSHSYGGWKFEIRVQSMVGFRWGPFSKLADFLAYCLLTVCLHDLSSVCARGDRYTQMKGWGGDITFSFYKGTSPIRLGPHPHDLI